MRLFRIKRKDKKVDGGDDEDWGGYDQYDSAVVCAADIVDAITIHPCEWINDGPYRHRDPDEFHAKVFRTMEEVDHSDSLYGWTTQDNIEAEYIGEADPSLKRGVIISSYNAG